MVVAALSLPCVTRRSNLLVRSERFVLYNRIHFPLFPTNTDEKHIILYRRTLE